MDASGNKALAPEILEITTDPLPDNFPPIKVTHCNPDKRNEGLILFTVRHSPASSHLEDFGLIVIIDRYGDIVWYYRVEYNIGDARRLHNGNLIFVTFDHRIIEIDMLGNIIRQWYAASRWETDLPNGIPLDMNAIHHTIVQLPSGNLIALGMEERQFPDYPTSESDPCAPKETANVIGDVLVEFSLDGTIEKHWKILDILDPYRVVYGTLSGYWIWRGFPESRDWCHANGVAYDPADNSLIISLRTQDTVIKIGRENGKLVWILGPHGSWRAPWSKSLLEPVGECEWAFHQHDPSVLPNGNIMMFDNGTYRALPPDKKMPDEICYSRAVEFSVDKKNMTVKQVWSYGGPDSDSLFATYQGGVLRLPDTGNIFINYGGVIIDKNGHSSSDNKNEHCSAYLMEVTYDAPCDKVFEMIIGYPSDMDKPSLSSFRSEHLPSLYI